METTMNVLIAERDPAMTRIVRNLLVMIGVQSSMEASDGTAALQILRENKVDLVLAAWNMSPMDGLQLLKEIRADKALSATPFIIMTTTTQKDAVATAAQAGVNNFIIKPFNAETLKQKIQAVMGPF
jgi:two-component system, chemotaxis family, chemotaxis protein CheY